MIGFIRKWQTAVTAGALILVAVVGFARLESVSDENRTLIDRANNETITRQVDACRTSREFRRTFPRVLRQLADPPTEINADLDFTAVPGFDALDVELQAYLTTLGTLLSQSGGGSSEFLIQTAVEYERNFPPPDCVGLRAELKVNLHAQEGDGD